MIKTLGKSINSCVVDNLVNSKWGEAMCDFFNYSCSYNANSNVDIKFPSVVLLHSQWPSRGNSLQQLFVSSQHRSGEGDQNSRLQWEPSPRNRRPIRELPEQTSRLMSSRPGLCRGPEARLDHSAVSPWWNRSSSAHRPVWLSQTFVSTRNLEELWRRVKPEEDVMNNTLFTSLRAQSHNQSLYIILSVTC